MIDSNLLSSPFKSHGQREQELHHNGQCIGPALTRLAWRRQHTLGSLNMVDQDVFLFSITTNQENSSAFCDMYSMAYIQLEAVNLNLTIF